ncbi:MAG TPA: NAD(P)-dependent oxidoreductase [Terriglobales bacterium]|nr:NAD(P)-dependent oxidoreductase [Terriglobales bacterium]
MRILITGSAGHLGEALSRKLSERGNEVIGLDICESPFTQIIDSVMERNAVRRAMKGIDSVLHVATLHKPHVGTHGSQDFVDTNITGTLNLLEEAVSAGVKCFVFTSTTSVFGDALIPPPRAPAAWITEEITPVPKNIYGVTKASAEDLCHLFYRNEKLPCIVLRTSRFFPEEDDDPQVREAYADENVKANEYLYRRVDIEDVVSAHFLALRHGPRIGFRRYVISATTPFLREDLRDLRSNALSVVHRRFPDYKAEYQRCNWKMFPVIDRVYVNERARSELGWTPRYDFRYVLERLKADEDFRSPLARLIGSKGYHAKTFTEGPYPLK